MDDRKMRNALEWYVDQKDEWYWERTKSLVEQERHKAATLNAISAAALAISVLITFCVLLRKSS